MSLWSRFFFYLDLIEIDRLDLDEIPMLVY